MKHNGIPNSHSLRGIFRLTLMGDFTIPRVNFNKLQIIDKELEKEIMCVIVEFRFNMEKEKYNFCNIPT